MYGSHSLSFLNIQCSKLSRVPPNLQFEIDDIEFPWTYRESSFDYIHIRYMFSGIKDWHKLLEECYKALKPGGFVEIIEMDITPASDDGTIPEQYLLNEYFDILKRAALTKGFDLAVAPKLKNYVASKPFCSVTEEVMKLPFGPWPRDQRMKEIGLFHREQFLEGLEGIIIRYLTMVEGWVKEEVEVFLAKVRTQVKDRRIHSYWQTYVFT